MAALSAFAQKIEIESDQTVDFSKFHTFAIRDGRLNSRNPSLISELVKKRIDADIQKYRRRRDSPTWHRANPVSMFAIRWAR